MATFAKQFQDEVRRLARKEFKDDFQRLQQEHVQLRRLISELRKKLAGLEKGQKRIQRVVTTVDTSSSNDAPEGPKDRARISSTTVKNLRKKLGLSQADFGKLVGVSMQAVYQWESKGGRLQLRNATRQAIAAVKSIGKKEARERLARVER